MLRDQLRADAHQSLAALRSAGVNHIVLASGDRQDIARTIGSELGVDAAIGDMKPAGKLALLQCERTAIGTVMMVGDGVNDAPALAAADVDAAMDARGAAASSEAAGIVLLVDALTPLAQAITIARRTRNIALQSVIVGLGLSLAAAFGYPPGPGRPAAGSHRRRRDPQRIARTALTLPSSP